MAMLLLPTRFMIVFEPGFMCSDDLTRVTPELELLMLVTTVSLAISAGLIPMGPIMVNTGLENLGTFDEASANAKFGATTLLRPGRFATIPIGYFPSADRAALAALPATRPLDPPVALAAFCLPTLSSITSSEGLIDELDAADAAPFDWINGC